ncbi:Yip1 family protein [Comamonas sp. NLF-1-9]|uniref:Yip1 family protein n=1 Tax=Comamonas sp. NLF-1-9 TaxID=2853163 RepID=UPI001C47DBA0|nr:Yip1 family protein [Comamonas sp. NLF-1-9]QXL84142.1 YIP1 family protein [Comamonas sp. NLF-1-9]
MNTIVSDAGARAALLKRVGDILLRPRETWPQIEAEDGSPAAIYKNYLVYLAAIPAVAGFIGYSLIGASVFGVTVRTPVAAGLVNMVVGYVLSLALAYVLTLIVNQLAPRFQARQDMGSAFKLVAYASTAGMLGGVFNLLPLLSMLGLLAALYSIYLVYTGIPVLMKAPQEKALGYTGAVVVCGVIVAIVAGLVMSVFTPASRGVGGGLAGAGSGESVTLKVPGTDITIDTRAIEAASRKMEAAQSKGDADAAAKAAGEAIGAALGLGGASQALEPQQLRAALPESLGKLARTAVEARSDSALGMKMSTASASYDADGQTVEITVRDVGASPALRMGLAAWSSSEVDSEKTDSVERVYRQGKTAIQERYAKDGSSAELAMLLPNGILLEASGAVGIEELKRHLLPMGKQLAAIARTPA